jgi:hypothetical protein
VDELAMVVDLAGEIVVFLFGRLEDNLDRSQPESATAEARAERREKGTLEPLMSLWDAR